MFRSDNQVLLESIWRQASKTWYEIIADAQGLICTLPKTINYKHDTQGEFAGVSWSEIIIDKITNPLVQ